MTETSSRALLVRELARLYWDDDSVRRLLDFASIPASLIAMGKRPIDTWFSAVREADNRGRRADLLKVALLEHPDNELLQALLVESIDRPPRDLATAVLPDGSPERIMGTQSTLLPISFLELGLKMARCVGRISAQAHAGTAFVIAGDLIVTNNHVLPDAETASDSTLVLNLQHDVEGKLKEPVAVKLDPARTFRTSTTHDLTVCAADPGVSSAWGFVPVDPSAPVPQRVNIIQHPGGGPKQVALYHNVVSHHDDDVLQYFTDTMPGSSGSPLFDDNWRLVGVHHAGGSLYSPTERRAVFRNEGISLRRLVELL